MASDWAEKCAEEIVPTLCVSREGAIEAAMIRRTAAIIRRHESEEIKRLREAARPIVEAMGMVGGVPYFKTTVPCEHAEKFFYAFKEQP